MFKQAALLGMFVVMALAATQDARTPTGDTLTCVSQLTSSDLGVRQSGANGLTIVRRAVAKQLLESLSTQPTSRECDSPFHLTVLSIGEWRIEEAAAPLGELIGFQLDPSTFPVGGRRPASAFHPAAEALGRIGGPAVVKVVQQRMTKPMTEVEQRAGAWVLEQTLGRKLALQAVADFGKGPNAESGANAAALSSLLASNDPLLRVPQ